MFCRDDCRIQNGGPQSPLEDVLDLSPSGSDMPGWKTANQELAAILTNLRRLEHHLLGTLNYLYMYFEIVY